MNSKHSRNCPLCGSNAKELLYRQSFAMVEQVSFIDGYDVVVCDVCGFAYADDIPSQDAFDLYYSKQSKYETVTSEISSSRLEIAKHDIDFLGNFLDNKNLKILEIGCGAGDFLRVLKQDGFEHVVALDPSEHGTTQLSNFFGVKSFCGTVLNHAITESFDLIILLTVMEHVVDVSHTIEVVARLQNPGGKLFIRVPDAEKFPDYDDSPFQQFSHEHINYFSRSSTETFLNLHGYSLLREESVGMNENNQNVLPMLNLLFVKDYQIAKLSIRKDELTKLQLLKYIGQSTAKEAELNSKLLLLAQSGEPIIVWGTGTHTLRLLKTGNLKNCNIVAFVDSNPHYAGGNFNGIPVGAPEELLKYSYKILISSKVFQNEIVDCIKNTLKAPNDLILLY